MTQKPDQKQVIVAVCGGLGNQMFQYAAGHALAIAHNASSKLDLSAFPNHHSRAHIPMHSRPFDLKCFGSNTDCESATRLPLFRRNGIVLRVLAKLLKEQAGYITGLDHTTCYLNENQNSSLISDYKIASSKSRIYLNGYWQNELNFVNCEAEGVNDLRQSLVQI